MLLTDYLRTWLDTHETCIERSTHEAETVYFNRHIIPYFEPLGLELSQVKAAHIQQYANTKLRCGRMDGKPGGLSAVSVRKHVALIRQALNDAVLQGEIDHSPALYVRLPRQRAPIAERTVMLEVGEAQTMIEAFRGHELFPAVVLTLYYGLRRSEVLGLKWDAVDFEKNTLEIRHTVVKNLTIECKDRTKTASSHRKYELLPEVRAMLLALREGKTHDNPYICTKSDGSPIRPDSLTRGFQRVLARHGLKPMRFHDLRHSTASILFDQGWSLEDVKNWLGHTDIETTSNIYLHYSQNRKVLLAVQLCGVLQV